MARRKRGGKSADYRLVKVVVILAALCVLVPSLRPIVLRFLPLVLVAGFVILALAVFVALKPRLKGKVGERIVSTRLRDGLSSGEYVVLDDVYLPIGEGGTTQIDHIVVSRYGVFVVETKHYTGWIFASAKSSVWTQTVYHKKSTFQNPIRQNYRHICAISENLGIPKEYLKGVVAFTGDCEFKTELPSGVVYSRQAANHIKGFRDAILKDKEVADILQALREWDASVTPQQRRAHVANLKRRHS